MRTARLFRAIGDIDDDLVEQARCAGQKPALRPRVIRWGAAAACLLLIIGVATGVNISRSLPQIQPGVAVRVFSAPVGPRRMFNWNGCRYVFVENGAPYDFSAFDITERLGSLEYDMQGMESGEAPYIQADGATTWALGGALYAIPGYDSAFRIAVEEDGVWYMAELVARVDDTPLDAEYYFRVADMKRLVRRAELLPHMGGESLHTLGWRQARGLVDILSTAQPAKLTGEQYQQLAGAQSQGRSWQLSLLLGDGTAVNLYVVPDMGIVSIGDGYYRLPDAFAGKFGDIFDSLPRQAIPAG